jgi:branched-subunit amino acid aminotransferase/4-amino-4-deoxychorismate lyase
MSKLKDTIEEIKKQTVDGKHIRFNIYFKTPFVISVKNWSIVKEKDKYYFYVVGKKFETYYATPHDWFYDLLATIDNDKNMALLNIREKNTNRLMSIIIDQILQGNEIGLDICI